MTFFIMVCMLNNNTRNFYLERQSLTMTSKITMVLKLPA